MIQKKGAEADDYIASYTKTLTASYFNVVILSNDGDMHQLVQSPVYQPAVETHVVVYKPTRGIYVSEKQVRRYLHGAAPSLHPDVRALCGDHWGKAPGVPGGMAVPTASALLAEHGSLPKLLRNLHKVGAQYV